MRRPPVRNAGATAALVVALIGAGATLPLYLSKLGFKGVSV